VTMTVEPDYRTEHELRSLLSAVHLRLADSVYEPKTGSESVSRFLAEAPVDACMKLADTWVRAIDKGFPTDRFTAEEQFMLEMVTAIYAEPSAAPGTAAVFARLLNEIGTAEAA
jgi:hypothetical protein